MNIQEQEYHDVFFTEGSLRRRLLYSAIKRDKEEDEDVEEVERITGSTGTPHVHLGEDRLYQEGVARIMKSSASSSSLSLACSPPSCAWPMPSNTPLVTYYPSKHSSLLELQLLQQLRDRSLSRSTSSSCCTILTSSSIPEETEDSCNDEEDADE